MVLSIHRYKAAATALLCVAITTPARAEVPPLAPFNYQLKYDVAWNNLPIGRIRIDVSEDEYRYSMNVDTKTRGIVRMFDSTTSTITAKGHMDDGTPVAQRYESVSKDSDSTKVTTVTYNGDGSIKTRKRNPADDPAHRPPVPIDDANRGVDPLTAMIRLRTLLHDNIARNVRDSTLRTYDGARLADFTFTVASRASLKIMGEHVNAINTVLKRTPIAGYKDKELKKYRAGDPGIHVYFSADERMLPLEADINLSFGMITAKLSEVVETKK